MNATTRTTGYRSLDQLRPSLTPGEFALAVQLESEVADTMGHDMVRVVDGLARHFAVDVNVARQLAQHILDDCCAGACKIRAFRPRG